MLYKYKHICINYTVWFWDQEETPKGLLSLQGFRASSERGKPLRLSLIFGNPGCSPLRPEKEP